MTARTRFLTPVRAAVSGAALLAGAGALIAPALAQSQPLTVERLANGAPITFADIIEQVSPAVVAIRVKTEVGPEQLAEQFNFDGAPEEFEQFFRRFFDEDEPPVREGRSLGSGFFISSDGHVVTNAHVVKDATEVLVVLDDEREFEAEVMGVDDNTDLAVLKVEGEERFQFVDFGETDDLRVGDWVVAVGNPFGLSSTATSGIVSAKSREIGGTYNSFLQIDAPINRGNSGGPTFNLQGQVVGVNSQIFSPSGGSVGIGFAIPSETVKRITAALISEGKVVRGWLGVQIQSVTEDIALGLGLDAESGGAIVSSVVPDSPAADAGFRSNDVVLELNGQAVDDAIDLTRRVGDLVVGERVRFKVLRDGRERTLRVNIAERPAENLLASLDGDEPSFDDSSAEDSALGMALRPMEDTERRALDVERGEGGVFVDKVERGTDAWDKGLRAGQAILSVNGETVSNPADVAKAIEQATRAGREAVLMLVQDPRGRRFLAVTLDDEDQG